MKDLLLNYTRYNFWANNLFCDFLKNNLSEEQMNREIISSFPSVKKTVLHIWDAEVIWLTRLKGNSLTTWPGKNFTGTAGEAVHGLLNHSKDFADFVSTVENSFFEKSLHYSRVSGEKYENKASDIVQHVMNHSTYHRGQLVTMLRQLGFTELFSTDYITFCRGN